jgi:glycine cleavage system H lipoate-binding protein/ABC-type phosphate transport system substrate-binding protein
MKNSVLLFIGLMLLQCSNLYSEEVVVKNDKSREGSINVLSTPELVNLTSSWASGYSSLNPEFKINVISAENANTGSFREAGANSGFVSGDKIIAPEIELLWKMAVGREIIVPVTNSKNPFLGEIYQQGISPEKFARIFNNPEKRVWGTVLTAGQNVPVHLYVVNDGSVIAAVKKFIDISQVPADGIYTGSVEEMITAIRNDPYSIGFCKMVSIAGPDKQSMIENISFLPIDKNGNGKIDYMEKIYDDINVFARGVWIGKYPKALYSDVYYVSSGQPENETEIAFLKWILTDGQQFLYLNGYNDLAHSERLSKLEKLNPVNINVPPSKDIYSMPFLALISLMVIILISILISAIVYYRRNIKSLMPASGPASTVVFNQDSVIVPGGLYFDKTHTWAFMEKDGIVKIGIDDFLQHITGPMTRIEMKKPGEKIKKGDVVLSIIQKGKQLNIYSPVSGIIREQNKLLLANTALINSSPYSAGWVYEIEPANWLREIQFLDMAEKYKKWLRDEFTRLKDFLAASLKINKLEYEHVVLQDGGVLKDSILEDLGPEVWEDFQTNFLDTYK